MIKTLEAIYDGKALQLKEPLGVPPGTSLRVAVETEPETELISTVDREPYCFFRFAASLNLKGPPDSSERLHERLYGEGARGDDE